VIKSWNFDFFNVTFDEASGCSDAEEQGHLARDQLIENFRGKIRFYGYVFGSLSTSPCLSVCLPVCLSACLPVCLSACLPVCLSACLYIRNFVFLFKLVSPFVYFSFSDCLFLFL
jgi:hypothetical protein